MPDLFIEINDEQGRPVSDASAGWAVIRPDGSSRAEEPAEDLPGSERKRARVPDSGETDIILRRPGAPVLRVRLDFAHGPNEAKFVRGRPSMMTLRSERVQGRQERVLVLRVTWGDVEEVVLIAGADTHADFDSPQRARNQAFVGMALRRFRQMGSLLAAAPERGIIRVNRSCVLTLVQFDNRTPRSAFHHLLLGRGTRDLPGPEIGRTAGSVLMYSRPVSNISIMHVYEYLTWAGRNRPGTIRAIEFLSHGYWIGPALENTFRTPWYDFCHAGCPIDRPHGSFYFKLHDPLDIFEHQAGNEIDYVCGINFAVPAGIARTRQHDGRAQSDVDPRNTDFVSTVLPSDITRSIKASLSADAQLRVWGCNVSDVGGRMRATARRGSLGGNVLINQESQFRRPPIPQHWSVRAEDVKLLYLSMMRRSYGQALATHLDRPCYVAPLGAGSIYTPTPQLRGMQVQASLARPLLPLLRSLPGFSEPDEAGYYRLVPDPPRYVANIKILISGFAPFGGSTSNAASEAVRRIQNIRPQIEVPPWIELNLEQYLLSDVHVVWSCPGAHQAQSHDGARRILERAQDLDADLVILVGESSAMARSSVDIRIEYYARNRGCGTDTLGNDLPFDSVLVPGWPEILKSSVPSHAWAKAIFDLRHKRPIHRVHIPHEKGLFSSAGEFICNEAYYQLLQEAAQSGRWVSFVHVAAYRTPERYDYLRDAIMRISQTFIEEMLWARVPYGREATSKVRARRQ